MFPEGVARRGCWCLIGVSVQMFMVMLHIYGITVGWILIRKFSSVMFESDNCLLLGRPAGMCVHAQHALLMNFIYLLLFLSRGARVRRKSTCPSQCFFSQIFVKHKLQRSKTSSNIIFYKQFFMLLFQLLKLIDKFKIHRKKLYDKFWLEMFLSVKKYKFYNQTKKVHVLVFLIL